MTPDELLQQLEPLTHNVRMRHDERLGRLALAALVTQSQSRGWNDERLVRLRSYRADPAPLVVAAAQFTLPPTDLSS